MLLRSLRGPSQERLSRDAWVRTPPDAFYRKREKSEGTGQCIKQKYREAFVPEWSKGAVSRTAIERCVGSNPTGCIFAKKNIRGVEHRDIGNNNK